eukprot:scaffold650447_cov42-Prasinocladus_malaysianus.AAC.1
MPQRQPGLLLRPKARFTLGRKTCNLIEATEVLVDTTDLKAHVKQNGYKDPEDAIFVGTGYPGRGVRPTTGTAKRKREEPLLYLEPKVMVPYDAPPGAVPRRVEIDRRKRLYAAQHVPDLIAKEGADIGKASAFDLAVFDNTDFEQRLAREW